MTDLHELTETLATLRNSDSAAARQLSAIAHVHDYPKGNVLFYHGEPSDAVYIVLEGKVKISFISDEGREVILAVMRPGGIFGLLGALDNSARHVGTAVTIGECRLAKIPRSQYLAWFDGHPELHRPMLGDFAQMLSEAYEKIGQQALFSVKDRLLAVLLDMARADGRPREGEAVEFDRPTHQELAEMVGTTRVVVSRLFKELIAEHDVLATEKRGKVIRVSLKKVEPAGPRL
ncbi:MAG TPA: Crp/Fnr family transcriptional regulator [Longimicrobiales bacterium]|nr:Crp/Fnr family transcriptional regulator [Longimicrobiales bacterium]